MRHLKDIAQAACFAAMKPPELQIAAPANDSRYDAGTEAFERARWWAAMARHCRAQKRACTRSGIFPPGWWESNARKCEQEVREIALQSEITLQRQADQLPAGPCHQPMLNILLGYAA